MHDYDVPAGFWRSVCEDVDHPIACVDLQNRFTWVNHAYELLTGYSIEELVGRTWMSITVQTDIGGDLASVQAVIDGKISAYSLTKDYVHKKGSTVSVNLTVRRFPASVLEDMTCFRVEAPLAKVDIKRFNEVQRTLLADLDDLRARMSRNEDAMQNGKGVRINVGDTTGGDHIGHDKNSDSAIKFMTAAFGVMVLIVAYLFYYVANVANKVDHFHPPSIPSIPVHQEQAK